ncbi:MAG TPA: TerC family protein [Candidatus Acidoferrales bacterium]|jgi:tellurite resistance protein TerC|nr:TerC family protein [Candidatus Acidoferrales bacterium]
MLGLVAITPLHWAGFILCILFFLALDLGVLNRGAQVVTFRQALRWSVFWCILAMVFAGALVPLRGREESVEFITGYVIELSLSMDNVFVIALIFAFFRVPAKYQHRVLFWGILGALIMRGVMILAGSALIERFQWTLYLFGAFLVYTGIKMMLTNDEGVDPEKNFIIRLARKCFPVADGDHGEKFVVRVNARSMLTTLALVLLMVETTDLIFALDSIPAIFAVTTKPFIVFTSNVFAILGLRSLYFVLAGAIGYFRYLKAGLSIVLVFVGAKMLVDPHGDGPHKWFQFEVSTLVSLVVIGVILAAAMLLSLVVAKREHQAGTGQDK